MYRHVACLLAFAGVLCSRPVYADITSTGTFTNANLIWANGIAGLKFTFTDSCGGIQTCSFSWGHDGSTILISRSFTGTITCPATSDYGLVCNSDGLNLVSTITILNGLTKNLTEISISGATTGSFSRTITLLTCPRFPGANELTSDGCTAYNHNCESTFGCGDGYVGGDFTRTCTFDATWDNATSGCVKNLTFGDPDRDDGIAIGSTARVNTSVTDGIPINGDYTINWKAGTVIVASYSLTTSGAGTVTYPSSVFKGRINLSGTTAANMAVVVQNLSSSDNGTQLSVCALHGGLDAGSSNSIELEVRECPSFSDAEPVEETCNPYHFDCTTTFRCNIAGNIFTATCLSNATFDSRSECASSTASIPITSVALTSVSARAASEEPATSSMNVLHTTVTSVSEGNIASGFAEASSAQSTSGIPTSPESSNSSEPATIGITTMTQGNDETTINSVQASIATSASAPQSTFSPQDTTFPLTGNGSNKGDANLRTRRSS